MIGGLEDPSGMRAPAMVVTSSVEETAGRNRKPHAAGFCQSLFVIGRCSLVRPNLNLARFYPKCRLFRAACFSTFVWWVPQRILATGVFVAGLCEAGGS